MDGKGVTGITVIAGTETLQHRRGPHMLKWLGLFASITLVALYTNAIGHETKHKSISIAHPWVLETEAPQTALHMKIKNTGEVTERLLRASTPLAGKVSILDPEGKDVRDLAIPARGELTLKSDGPHILLSGLKKPLRAYDSFELTLVFETAGAMNVEVIVEERSSDTPGAR